MVNPDIINCLNQIHVVQGMIVKTFMGCPVRVDPELERNEWYVCVSKEMLSELEKVDNG